MAKQDCGEYPGRTIPDERRTSYGLGWEHRRRGWSIHGNEFSIAEDQRMYELGYAEFHCSDPHTNHAMLTRGVKVTL